MNNRSHLNTICLISEFEPKRPDVANLSKYVLPSIRSVNLHVKAFFITRCHDMILNITKYFVIQEQ